MKFTVSSSELLKGLLAIQKAIPVKTTEAMLENYLVELEADRLNLTTSDTEVTLKTFIKVKNDGGDGRMAIPSRQITEILKELPDQPITIETIDEKAFRCSWDSGASTFPFFDAKDYPLIDGIAEDGGSINMDGSILVDAINKTLYAASEDDSRPIMGSILFDITTESITLVSSDLQKLVCYSNKDLRGAKDASLILNRKHAGILKGIIDKNVGEVEIHYNDKKVSFTFGNTTMLSNLVVGKYPNYKSIIPTNNNQTLTIGRTLLLNAVKRVAVCSPKNSNHIALAINESSLELSTQDVGFNVAAHDKIACSYSGTPMKIGFKAAYIIEVLSNLNTENVVLKFLDPRHAIIIQPEEEDPQILTLIMPVIVQ